MKNVYKSIIFVVILFCIVEALTWLLLPGFNIDSFGTYNVSAYEILGEEQDTIEAVAVGDSLVYSSLSPMEIWNSYGYTVFDCAEAAQVIPDAYHYLEIAVESQHPKVVLMEANILFRDPKKRLWRNTIAHKAKNYVPIVKYHDNWKNYLSSGTKDNWINVNKGYKYITQVEPSKKKNYMKYSKKNKKLPEGNLEYFNKIIDLCKKNDIKLVLVSFPSQTSWSYKKHNGVIKLLKQYYDIDFLDLNLAKLGIDWKNDTKDNGSHLNYLGAKKVSDYVGNYLKETNLLTDHRNDPEYELWNKAYKKYLKNSVKD